MITNLEKRSSYFVVPTGRLLPKFCVIMLYLSWIIWGESKVKEIGTINEYHLVTFINHRIYVIAFSKRKPANYRRIHLRS